MKSRALVIALLLFGSRLACAQGLPPLGAPPDQKPSQGLPPLGASPDLKLGASPAGTLSVDAANADLKIARAANAEKRFADAETLMRKDANLRPNMPQLWVELGQAQLGQKKY